MKTVSVTLLNHDDYKPGPFEGVEFPVEVQGIPLKRGRLAGWVNVTRAELEKVGMKLDPTFEELKHDPDHGFLFAPKQIIIK